MVFVAPLKNKMRFTSRNFKFKIPLNCTDGTTLPQYGICKNKNTGTKLNKSISSAHNILPKNALTGLMTITILCMGVAINQLVSYVEKHRVCTGTYMCR